MKRCYVHRGAGPICVRELKPAGLYTLSGWFSLSESDVKGGAGRACVSELFPRAFVPGRVSAWDANGAKSETAREVLTGRDREGPAKGSGRFK